MEVIYNFFHLDGTVEKHYDNGTIAYYKDEELHREGEPAVRFFDGTKKWLVNGKHHREDGPAIEWSHGEKEWWLNGKSLLEQEFISWKLEKELNQELPKNNIAKKKLKV
jgi:hypothetical protein